MSQHTIFWYLIITSTQKPPIKAHVDVSRGTRDLIFGLSHPILPYFVYARSKCSSEAAHMRSLA